MNHAGRQQAMPPRLQPRDWLQEELRDEEAAGHTPHAEHRYRTVGVLEPGVAAEIGHRSGYRGVTRA